jgi:hypothetical protein
MLTATATAVPQVCRGRLAGYGLHDRTNEKKIGTRKQGIPNVLDHELTVRIYAKQCSRNGRLNYLAAQRELSQLLLSPTAKQTAFVATTLWDIIVRHLAMRHSGDPLSTERVRSCITTSPPEVHKIVLRMVHAAIGSDVGPFRMEPGSDGNRLNAVMMWERERVEACGDTGVFRLAWVARWIDAWWDGGITANELKVNLVTAERAEGKELLKALVQMGVGTMRTRKKRYFTDEEEFVRHGIVPAQT